MRVRPLCSSYMAGAWTVLVHQQERSKRDVVHAVGQVRHQVGHFQAGLAVLAETARAGQQRRIALGELADRLAEALGQRLAVVLFQRGFGVEQVDVAGAADHEERK